MNAPRLINSKSFQHAWISTTQYLCQNGWESRNIVVHISDPTTLDRELHTTITSFFREHQMLTPKAVAYTIFPHNFYRRLNNADILFDNYNRPHGMYDRLKTSWGTYFRRMTYYQTPKGPINQLSNIISAIRYRKATHKAAYTILIQNPGGETIRCCGSPCLNYLAVQLESGNQKILGLLAVYRNHDFLKKAYGNYWGLCNLLQFLAAETNYLPGPLTCISSRAYIDNHKQALKILESTHE